MSDELKKAAKQRLQDMLAELKENLRIVNTDLSGVDPWSAAGHVNRRREAEDQVKVLTAGYHTLITNSIVKVFVTGPRAAEFAKKADAEGAVVVNAQGMYEDFAAVIEPSLDHKLRQFTSSQIALLIQVMQRYMQQNRIHHLERPRLEAMDMDVRLEDTAGVVAYVKKAIRNTNSDDLVAHDLTNKVLATALAKNAANTVLPVILYGLLPDETQSLSVKLFGSQPTVFVEATEQTADEDLIQLINEKILAVFNSKK